MHSFLDKPFILGTFNDNLESSALDNDIWSSVGMKSHSSYGIAKNKNKKKNFIDPKRNTFEYQDWCFHLTTKTNTNIIMHVTYTHLQV